MTVKVCVLALGDVPPRLAEGVLAGLPRPWTGGEIGRLPVSLDRCYDKVRAQPFFQNGIERLRKAFAQPRPGAARREAAHLRAPLHPSR